MCRLCLLGVLFVAGCSNIDGPFRRTTKERADDPSYSIAEQERRGRASYAVPDDSRWVGPRSGASRQILETGR